MEDNTEIEEVYGNELLQGHSSLDQNDDCGNDNHQDIHSTHHSTDNVSSLVKKLQEKIHHQGGEDAHEVSFGSSIYNNDAEIDKMEHDVDMARSEVAARKSDVSNWESKVSLNNTEEHKKKRRLCKCGKSS